MRLMKRYPVYILRVFVLSALHFYLKLYDQSFAGELFSFSARSVTFYFLCVSYSMLVWWAASKLFSWSNSKHKHKSDFRIPILIYIALLLPFGFVASVVFGNLYFLMDTQIFGIWRWWFDFRGFDFDLNVGYLMFYTLITGASGLLFFFNQWKDIQISAEKLKKEYIQSKYEALKNQIDPHFFFNSLSVLASLVYKDADLSSEYITKLSLLYRYILENRERYFARISDEIEFLNNYMFLIHTRHPKAIRLEIDTSVTENASGFVLPNSIQMLTENAVKHNKFSAERPLCIIIRVDGGKIEVRNNLDKKILPIPGTRVGLENISNRYALIGLGPIDVSETAEEFIVRIPIIKENEVESYHI